MALIHTRDLDTRYLYAQGTHKYKVHIHTRHSDARYLHTQDTCIKCTYTFKTHIQGTYIYKTLRYKVRKHTRHIDTKYSYTQGTYRYKVLVINASMLTPTDARPLGAE
jgi:hypothetical protein